MKKQNTKLIIKKWAVVVAQLAIVVTSNNRGLRLDSSHRQLLMNQYIMLSICRKDESEEEETRNGPLKKLIKKDSFQVD